MTSDEQEVKVTGPAGLGASLRGSNILLPAILTITLALVVYLGHLELESNRKLAMQVFTEMRSEHTRILTRLDVCVPEKGGHP